jgi:hypothetical protein
MKGLYGFLISRKLFGCLQLFFGIYISLEEPEKFFDVGLGNGRRKSSLEVDLGFTAILGFAPGAPKTPKRDLNCEATAGGP